MYFHWLSAELPSLSHFKLQLVGRVGEEFYDIEPTDDGPGLCAESIQGLSDGFDVVLVRFGIELFEGGLFHESLDLDVGETSGEEVVSVDVTW